MMKQIISLDDYRHKLVEKMLRTDSLEQIKRYILTALKSLRAHGVNEHLIERFISKTINQLQGLSLLDLEVQIQLNARYARSQLEMMRRHTEERKANHA